VIEELCKETMQSCKKTNTKLGVVGYRTGEAVGRGEVRDGEDVLA